MQFIVEHDILSRDTVQNLDGIKVFFKYVGTEFNGNHDLETFICFTKRPVFLTEVAVNLVSITEGFRNSQRTAA
jgi:hypothetical protein